MKKEILKRGYITHALTNESGKVYGLDKSRCINDWSLERKERLYWSEVYCEAGYLAKVIRMGECLINTTDAELSKLHEQSKVNLNPTEEEGKERQTIRVTIPAVMTDNRLDFDIDGRVIATIKNFGKGHYSCIALNSHEIMRNLPESIEFVSSFLERHFDKLNIDVNFETR